MTNDITGKLLDDFANTDEAVVRVNALTELMTHKIIPKHASDSRFEKGLDRWVEVANSSEVEANSRLLAVAELIRATQQLKKRQPFLMERIKPSIERPFPSLGALPDAEDRLNVARACSYLEADWLQSYLARSVAEEPGPKTRAELMAGVVARSNSIAETIECLITAFEQLQLETETPADSRAKRLTRTLEAFRASIMSTLLDAGDGVGEKLHVLLTSAFLKTGRPQDELVQIQLTREVALTLHDLVRTRFSLSTEPQTFQALKYCRTFFKSISWPSAVRKETDRLVQDVSEALVLMGRMGIPNQALLDRLELVCGIKERARAVATALAEKHIELDESIRSWLRLGRAVSTVTTSEVLQETLLDANDEALGLALIEVRELSRHGESIRKAVLTSLQILDPALAPLLQDYLHQATVAAEAIEDLAKRRNLELHGVADEEVEFTPKYFDALGGLRGARVTIVRPAIIRTSPGNSSGQVVKKGLVE